MQSWKASLARCVSLWKHWRGPIFLQTTRGCHRICALVGHISRSVKRRLWCGLKLYAFIFNFLLCNFRLRWNEVQGRNSALHVNKNASGRPHGEAEIFEVWLFPRAAGYVSTKKCGDDTLEHSYAQELLIYKTGGLPLIIGTECPAQTGHNDFDHHRGKNPRHSVIVNSREMYTFWVVPGVLSYAFYFEEENTKLWEMVKLER